MDWPFVGAILVLIALGRGLARRRISRWRDQRTARRRAVTEARRLLAQWRARP